MTYVVRGAEQLSALSRRLREAGDKGLQREMSRGINRAIKPLRADWAESARDRLPHRGGLADRVAASRVRVKRRTGNRVAGIRLEVSNEYQLSRIDRGTVRHRVFGQDVWVNQPVPAGTFSEPWEQAAPRIRLEIEAAMQQVARQIER